MNDPAPESVGVPTKLRLLDAAARHFARLGFERANINHISQAAGFSKGTVYNHFPSKAVLYAAVLQRASSETVARWEGEDGDLRYPVDPRSLRASLLQLAQVDRDSGAQLAAEFRQVRAQAYLTAHVQAGDLDDFGNLVCALIVSALKGEPGIALRLARLFLAQLAVAEPLVGWGAESTIRVASVLNAFWELGGLPAVALESPPGAHSAGELI